MMTRSFEASGDPISLARMLERREARFAAQQSLLSQFGRTLVQLTLVNPGPVKDTAQARFVFDQGLGALHEALAQAGLPVLAFDGSYFTTGPEMLMAIDAEPLLVKHKLLQVEEQHPLGRLWDVDVIDPTGTSVSRQRLDLPARLCLVCDQAAHACAHKGAHALHDLQRAVQDRINAYRSSLAY
jgi:holo-ACP synthase